MVMPHPPGDQRPQILNPPIPPGPKLSTPKTTPGSKVGGHRGEADLSVNANRGVLHPNPKLPPPTTQASHDSPTPPPRRFRKLV